MYRLLKPILFSFDPETAHNAIKKLSLVAPKSWLRSLTFVKSLRLVSSIGEKPLSNPIGLAAGFDKNGEIIDFMGSLGFGFLEIGSITAKPCAGNERPRIFRLPNEQSLINRMGLPNLGASVIAKKFAQKKINKFSFPLGMNIAKTPDFVKKEEKIDGIDDFLQTFAKLHSYGAYIVFNLSCPNTDDGIHFEDPRIFKDLAKAVYSERKSFSVTKPVLIKISPDLNKKSLTQTVELACDYGFDGFVVSNTTLNRGALKTPDPIEKGGLSGKGLTKLANAQLKQVYEIVGRKKLIIGVGGIMSFEDLKVKLSLGASLFQIYTGLIYQGPFFVKELNQKLDQFCEREGVKNYQELIGEPLH